MPASSIIARLATRICTCSGWASGPNSLLEGSTASSSVAPDLIFSRMVASCLSSISARSTVLICGTAGVSFSVFSVFSTTSAMIHQCTQGRRL